MWPQSGKKLQARHEKIAFAAMQAQHNGEIRKYAF